MRLNPLLEPTALGRTPGASYSDVLLRWGLGHRSKLTLLPHPDAHLPDGTWADILAFAGKAALPVNVIVVARIVNARLYIETIEAGAFGFILPPFDATDLADVVRYAADNVIPQRNGQPLADQAA